MSFVGIKINSSGSDFGRGRGTYSGNKRERERVQAGPFTSLELALRQLGALHHLGYWVLLALGTSLGVPLVSMLDNLNPQSL